MSDEPGYHVVVLYRGSQRIRAKQGPMPRHVADVVRQQIKKTLNRERLKVEVWLDRTAYQAARHKDKYANDPAYRERKLKTAREWQRKESAEARGDMTPWLEQQT